MCTPALFVRDNVGQVLQRPVRGNGKDAGHRLSVRTHRMQRQNVIFCIQWETRARFNSSSRQSYLEIVEQAIFLWQTYQAPGLIDWVLNVVDSLVVHPCRDLQARSSFLSAVFGGLPAFP